MGPPPEPPSPPSMGGYNGKILRVHLTSKTFKGEPLTYEIARKYVDGSGLLAHFLYKELKARIDPLGVETN